MKYAIVAVLLLPLAAAHLCLIDPLQRGTMMGLGTPGRYIMVDIMISSGKLLLL